MPVGALLAISLLVLCGIIADTRRPEWGVSASQLWGTIGVLILIAAVGGWQRTRGITSGRAEAPWSRLLNTHSYREALLMMARAAHADPERLDIFAEIAAVYASAEVDMPLDALVWLDAAIERADGDERAAALLYQRAEILHRNLGESRKALVDLIAVEKRFPGTPEADQAVALRERIRVSRIRPIPA